MNGLEKSIHELNNMLVQYEATTHKSEPVVLVGEASTSKAEGKRAGRWKRKKGKEKAVAATASAGGAPTAPTGKGKGKVGGSRRSRANNVCMHCQGKGHWKRECPQLLSNPGTFVDEVNMITNAASSVLDTGCEAHICNNWQVLERSRKLSKDEMILRLGDGKAVVVEAVGSLSLVGYALETTTKLFKIVSSKTVPQTPYEIWHGKPASYKYLRVWGSPVYVKRLVGDKIDSRSSLCRVFPSNSRHDEVLLEESSEEPRRDGTTSFEPPVLTDSVPILRRSTRESRAPERYRFMGLTSQLDNNPKTYGEAMSDIDSRKWLEAMKFEMDSICTIQVWTLVDPPKGVRPIGCKWVYKCKLGADGEVTAFKARLVAKGYTQRPQVDFEETYSPVAMAKSIRILLVIAAWYDYKIWQMDVTTTFLNSFIEKEIYMDQPEGFTAVREEQKVLGDIKAWLSTQFFMKDMGEASYILGIKIYRDRSRRMLRLTESSYIEKVLKRFKIENSKRGFLPMRHGVKLSKKQSPKKHSICCPVHQARCRLRFKRNEQISGMRCAGLAHWGAVKSILKYLKRTKDMFLIYGGGELILEGYSDASFQSNDNDAKSQSDFVFKLNGGLVTWKSSKQDTTGDSTTEAEYIAASEAVKEAV
ncbi:UNVERIFIED_CONTAM: Retrovirus-related Pol polyprotein from transposon TNT 1-94 [Sesamum latifolium]|uniref:Retrovirus-related Pol polyprotein from transposon TNT 1-94 n=1 Tax=Sesamum latifolium TaxID=2727402 RepID=A0AAW2XDQ8_9LAMI